jgi:hypothetical protein
MNTIGSMIATMDADFLLLSKRDQGDLANAVLLYVFRAIDSQELSEQFKLMLSWTGQKCIDFRNVLKGKGYIQKNYKFYLYAALNGQRIDEDDYEIRPDDVELCRRLKKATSEHARKLVAYCKGRARVGYTPRSLHEFNRGLSRVVAGWEVNCGKAVSKKLKFVTQSGQENREELAHELLCAALYAVYRAYPEIDDLLHMKNIGITALGNRCQNLIQEFKTKAKSRIVRNEDGSFSGTVLSMHTMDMDMVFSRDSGIGSGGSIITCNAMMVGIDGTSAEHERPNDIDVQRDLRLTVDKLIGKMKSERSRRFASILMGLHDPGFSEYLGMPNDEASDKMPYRDYSTRAKTYMEIPNDKAKAFMGRLRSELKDYGT